MWHVTVAPAPCMPWLMLLCSFSHRGSLTESQKLNYINAVQCLMSKPARTPSTAAPGAKNRFDDFVATHINQTSTIHYTANFLAWHRYYIWLYEQALKQECGYEGVSPVSAYPTHLLQCLPCPGQGMRPCPKRRLRTRA